MSKWAENISAKSKRTSRPVLLSEMQALQRNTGNMRNKLARRLAVSVLLLTLIAFLTLSPNPNTSLASSHREAPLIVADPLADNTDTYAFRSTEQLYAGG
jgi:hypothetical protein